MNNIFYSILLVLIGTFFGTIIFIVINYIRGIKVNKKIDEMLETAKKDAEKIKAMIEAVRYSSWNGDVKIMENKIAETQI